jgi:hypothetical protein
MLQLLLIGASLPLFVVIGWALLSPDQATGDQPERRLRQAAAISNTSRRRWHFSAAPQDRKRASTRQSSPPTRAP